MSLSRSVLCFEGRRSVGGGVFDSGYKFCQSYVTSKKRRREGFMGWERKGCLGCLVLYLDILLCSTIFGGGAGVSEGKCV